MSVTLLLRMRRHVHAFGITVYACAGMSTRSVLLYTHAQACPRVRYYCIRMRRHVHAFGITVFVYMYMNICTSTYARIIIMSVRCENV